ncbi:hypothetical protein NXV52_23210 [Bacteroides faecis]|uniref:hypothetical protein n=1 Tax=Bacteroides faecis TaxID=674529 RepID=UPI002165C351|nr:hypothetical protein [Bacteroides faecis]MCS3305822.1 hypothetical protein [Bacteroides faecis]
MRGEERQLALADGNQWGTDDGDLREVARFRDVSGLVYDDAKEIFLYMIRWDILFALFQWSKKRDTAGDENMPEDESTVESNE